MAKVSLPSIVSAIPNDLRNFLQRVRELLGSYVTKDDLVESGIGTIDNNGNLTPTPITVEPAIDWSTPPAPTGLTAVGSITTIFLEWDSVEGLYANLAYTEIWRSATDNLGTAVLNGTAAGSIYQDPVAPMSTYYYWVRMVSRAGVKGPYNATDGVAGATSEDPSSVLDLLAGGITESQLHADLGSRIDLIDGDGSGSVNARILNEASRRAEDILDEALARANADGTLQSQIDLLAAASGGDLSDLIAAVETETTARIAGDAAEASARQTLATQMRGSYTGTSIASLTSGLLYSERVARANADSALSSSISGLSSTVTTNNNTLTAAITSEQTTRASADSANATSISTLSSQVNHSTTGLPAAHAAISEEAITRATQSGELYAQYTIKLDVGGKVSGYGLASTGPFGSGSIFEIRADKIAFAAPAGASGDSCVPFVVDTVNNQVSIDAAFIKTASIGTAAIANAAITNAKIANLTANKIRTGTITGQEVTIETGGNIKSGQTAYNTGTGWWIGKGTDGYARFSVGSPTGAGFNWSQETGAMNFRGIMSLQSGSTIGGISSDYIGGWANSLDNTKIDGVNIHADSSILTGSTAPTVGGMYSVLEGGDITFYDYFDNQFNPHKSLKKIVHGECTDGVEVDLGYFRNPPRIIISSKNVDLYKQYYRDQDQKLIVEASTPEFRDNKYYFTPQCKLTIVGRDGTVEGTSNTVFELVSTADEIIADGLLYFEAVKTVYTTELTFPVNTKSITLHGYTKSQWAWLYINEAYIDVGRVDTTVTLQVRMGGVWYSVQSQSFSRNPAAPSNDQVSFIYTSSLDIERARLKIVYTGYSRYYVRMANILGLNSALGPESVDNHHYGITSCSYILANATLSYQAKANYMAIGD